MVLTSLFSFSFSQHKRLSKLDESMQVLGILLLLFLLLSYEILFFMKVATDFPHFEVLTCQPQSRQDPEKLEKFLHLKTHVSGFITWLCNEPVQKPWVRVIVLDLNLRLYLLLSSLMYSRLKCCVQFCLGIPFLIVSM